jgi:uncharacterized protein DUF3606
MNQHDNRDAPRRAWHEDQIAAVKIDAGEQPIHPSPQAPQEEAQLELADEHLIRYWSARFRCTPVELLAVVGRIGRSISLVQAEVARRASIRQTPRARG